MRVIGTALCAAALACTPAAARAADNGQLVAVTAGETTDGLVTLNPDGSGLKRIWTPTGQHVLRAPSWSPDGNRIVFADSGDDGGRVLLYHLSSGQVTQVASGGAWPTWTPDGGRIAFVRGTQIVTRWPDGGGEMVLPIDGTGATDLAVSPDGTLLALTVGGKVEVVGVDGGGRRTIASDSEGGSVWAPDSGSLVYPRAWSVYGPIELYRSFLGPDIGAPFTWGGSSFSYDVEPDWAPSGSGVVYVHGVGDAIPDLRIWSDGMRTVRYGTSEFELWEPDWQPCVAGVTLGCTSVAPLPTATPAPFPTPTPRPTLPPLTCPAVTTLTAVAGVLITGPLPCSEPNVRADVVTWPKYGGLTFRSGTYRFRVRSKTFRGQDSFTYRVRGSGGRVSNVATMVVNVTGAPKLTAQGTPRLDRRGRVLLRATCDVACTATLRVSAKLHTGRVVLGRAVTGSAAAGGTLSLRLTRGKVPARRRVISARIIGTVKGADGLQERFSLTLRR